MGKDMVMHPPKTPSGRKGIVQAKSSIIEGTTAQTRNLNPFARGESGSIKGKATVNN